MDNFINEFTDDKKYKFIDIFCGCGGWSFGFEKAGWNGLAGYDNNMYCIQSYNSNYKNTGKHIDVYNLDEKELEKYKNIDCLLISPPCQAFSKAGKRDEFDKRSNLLSESIRIISCVSPKFFILENVVGIQSYRNSDGINLFDNFINSLNKNYKIKYQYLVSSDFSSAQKRKRLFVVGNKLGIDFDFDVDEKYPDKYLKDILLNREDISSSYFHSQKMIDGFIRRNQRNKENGKGFEASIIEKPFDKKSRTISCRYYKDGSECLIKYDETTIRKLTEKEVARLQGFDDNYIFHGPKVEVYRQIENAVCVNVSQFLGNKIKYYLDKYRNEKPKEENNEKIKQITKYTG